ncbi:MAG: hypothetical protein RR828_03485, partial [Oscillospiraceae bacterium]
MEHTAPLGPQFFIWIQLHYSIESGEIKEFLYSFYLTAIVPETARKTAEKSPQFQGIVDSFLKNDIVT